MKNFFILYFFLALCSCSDGNSNEKSGTKNTKNIPGSQNQHINVDDEIKKAWDNFNRDKKKREEKLEKERIDSLDKIKKENKKLPHKSKDQIKKEEELVNAEFEKKRQELEKEIKDIELEGKNKKIELQKNYEKEQKIRKDRDKKDQEEFKKKQEELDKKSHREKEESEKEQEERKKQHELKIQKIREQNEITIKQIEEENKTELGKLTQEHQKLVKNNLRKLALMKAKAEHEEKKRQAGKIKENRWYNNRELIAQQKWYLHTDSVTKNFQEIPHPNLSDIYQLVSIFMGPSTEDENKFILSGELDFGPGMIKSLVMPKEILNINNNGLTKQEIQNLNNNGIWKPVITSESVHIEYVKNK